MSDLDDKIVIFKDSITKAAQYARGDENTDVVTPGGVIPSIAKQYKQNRQAIEAIIPNLNNRLRFDAADSSMTSTQRQNARSNIGLANVDNTRDIDKPLSAAMIQALAQVSLGGDAESKLNRNVENGYVGLSGFRIPVRDLNNTVTSYVSTLSTVSRQWVLPNKDGTVALLTDITGTNSGTNTGDETAATIRTKLGITTLAGSNTGDQVITLKGAVSGSGAGDITVSLNANVVQFSHMRNIASGTFLARSTAGTGSIEEVSGAAAKVLLGLDQIDNTSDVTKPLSDATIAALSGKQSITSRAVDLINPNNVNYPTTLAVSNALASKETTDNKAVDFSVADNIRYPSVLSVKNYVRMNLVGYLVDCGLFSASAGLFPLAGGTEPGGQPSKGNFWTISVAGTLGGTAVVPGDQIRALVSNPGHTASSWLITSGSPLTEASRNASNGVAGLSSFRLSLMDFSGTHKSMLQNAATAPRYWTFPDKDGTIAMLSDLAGLSSGTNTGDQTITLTGDVTGSGTGTFPATIANNAVTMAKLAVLGSGSFIGRNTAGTGNPESLSLATVRTMLSINNMDNTSDANKPLSTAATTALAAKEATSNKATNFNTLDNVLYPTTFAVNALVNSATTRRLWDGGMWDASGGLFPSSGGNGTAGAILRGNQFTISVAGSYNGFPVKPGDTIRALSDSPGQLLVNWAIGSRSFGYDPVNKAGDTMSGALGFAPSASVASAASVNLDTAASNVVDITGTVAINIITLASGAVRWVRFTGALTLLHSNALLLPGSLSITTAAGDQACFVGKGSGVVHCVSYQKATGEATVVLPGLDKVRNINANSVSTSIDLNNGDRASAFRVTIAANTTITFANPPPQSAAGELFSFTLITVNDATAGRAMAFGNTIKWAGGLLPPRTTAANAEDIWFFCVENGVYKGSLSMQDVK